MVFHSRTRWERAKLAFSIYWNQTKELFENLSHVIGLKKGSPIPKNIDYDTCPTPLKDINNAYNCQTNVYTTFSGCDVVVSFDGKVCGELQAIKYDLNPAENTGIMNMDFVMFAGSEFPPPNNSTMIASYANEYGRQAYQAFELLDCISVKSGFDINDIQQTLHAKYNCIGTGKYILPEGKIFSMDEHEIITTVWERLENAVDEKEHQILFGMRGRRIRFAERCFLDYLINKYYFEI